MIELTWRQIELIVLWQHYRQARDYLRSDEIRGHLLSAGVKVPTTQGREAFPAHLAERVGFEPTSRENP